MFMLLVVSLLISCSQDVDQVTDQVDVVETIVSDTSKLNLMQEILLDSVLRSEIIWYNGSYSGLELDERKIVIEGIVEDLENPLTSLQSYVGGPFALVAVYPGHSKKHIDSLKQITKKRVDLFHQYIDLMKE